MANNSKFSQKLQSKSSVNAYTSCPNNPLKNCSERRRFREMAKIYFFGQHLKQSGASSSKDFLESGYNLSKNSLTPLLNMKKDDNLDINSCDSTNEDNKEITTSLSSNAQAMDSTPDTATCDSISSLLLIETSLSFQLNLEYLNSRRVLILKNMSFKVSIDSILQGVYCGPIEKVVKILSNDNKNRIKYLELHFVLNKDAELFYQYAQTGNFVINGSSLQCYWANENINKVSLQAFEKIESLVFPENEQVYSQHGGSNIRTGARRCLILKKTMAEVKTSSGRTSNPYHLYSPNLADFNLNEIFNDFENFGEIINITPVISRRLCICINYYDIRSAIAAKNSFENYSSLLNKKYGKQWVMWYGKDVNDKPCISI